MATPPESRSLALAAALGVSISGATVLAQEPYDQHVPLYGVPPEEYELLPPPEPREIERSLGGSHEAMLACTTDGESVEGEVTLIIDQDGVVTGDESTWRSDDAERTACLMDVLRTTRFPVFDADPIRATFEVRIGHRVRIRRMRVE